MTEYQPSPLSTMYSSSLPLRMSNAAYSFKTLNLLSLETKTVLIPASSAFSSMWARA
jgi:hypothetical protein